MATVTIRSECPDCGKRIKIKAEANRNIKGQCPRCGCWLKIAGGTGGDSKSNGPDSDLPLANFEYTGSAPPPPAPLPPLPVPPAAPRASSTSPRVAPKPPAPPLAAANAPRSRRGLTIALITGSAAAVAVAVALLVSGGQKQPGEPSDPSTERNVQVAEGSGQEGSSGREDKNRNNAPIDQPEVVPPVDPGDVNPAKPGEAIGPRTRPGNVGPTEVADNRGTPGEQGGSRSTSSAPESKPGDASTTKPSTGLGERYALLISVSDYDEDTTGLTSLKFTESDVEELATVLKESGYQEHNIRVMSQSRGMKKFHLTPSRDSIVQQLDAILAGRNENDSVLVTFSGHGVKLQASDDSYFCPLGTNLEDAKTLISYREVYNKLAQSKAGFKLMLSDACRDEPIAKSTRSARRASVDLDSVTRPPDPPKNGGVAALFACSPGQFAFEHKDLNHGVFFHFVIKALRGEGDLHKDGNVTLSELQSYVEKHVPDFVSAKFQKSQTPHMQGDVQGKVVLVTLSSTRVATKPVEPPPPPPPPPPPGGDRRKIMAERNKLPEGSYPPKAIVPDVKNMSVAEARQMLHAAGLGVDTEHPLALDTDLVGKQSVFARMEVPSGTVVRLQNLQARLPNVVGMKYRDAQRLLGTEEGFKVSSGLSLESDLEINNQTPAAGQLQRRGDEVLVNHMVKSPNVIGMDMDTAIALLDKEGIATKVEGTYRKGDPVFFQSPKGGSLLAFGLPLKLTAGVTVPNIVGMSLDRANNLLAQSSINGKIVVTRQVPTPNPTATSQQLIEWQSVEPGKLMSRKDNLQVRVIQYVYSP